jgi:predicted naringenin-chalcone synthase
MFREFAATSLNMQGINVKAEVDVISEKTVAELIGAVVDRRLTKIEGLRSYLRRSVSRLLLMGCASGPPAVHDANDADVAGESMRSPITRLDAMQLVLVGAYI